ncbi:amino acid ABC transporter permease [Sinorhizobium meliloti]|uniref:amino acid ABC transporter permease n=1 Tax=Rhizobium meliloti TaxID=382 RepID=UPI000FD44F21|nr:amino acid ABC transporter permease [Sinorhizobium meliloti]RVE85601.1 amino acid ABC transporter permease [Sinorhizobium meliloti]RVE98458.1 amino acid ABC transporter permease [Sinorhizobium meliloti]RVM92543.1 amino acid ABC transporter permease [Sinorhizobium meliloti]
MLYPDTVESELLVHKPWFVGSIFGTVLLLCTVLNLAGTSFGDLMQPVIGDPAQSGVYGRLVTAFVFSILFCLNLALIGFAPRAIQIVIVWIELLGLFLLFVHSFDLNLPFIWRNVPFLIAQGMATTIYVSALSLVFASIIGTGAAIAKLSSNGFAYGIASFYTSFFRGVPLLMQVYLIYIGLPQLGIVLDAVPSGILALSVCFGAYMAEIFRSGIASIDRGQWEAARSMGFGFGLTMRKIILPQGVPVIIPPMGNMYIAMLKDSSLVSVLGVWELTFLARTLGQPTFNHLEMLVTVAVIYWILSICLELAQSHLERHFSRSKAR